MLVVKSVTLLSVLMSQGFNVLAVGMSLGLELILVDGGHSGKLLSVVAVQLRKLFTVSVLQSLHFSRPFTLESDELISVLNSEFLKLKGAVMSDLVDVSDLTLVRGVDDLAVLVVLMVEVTDVGVVLLVVLLNLVVKDGVLFLLSGQSSGMSLVHVSDTFLKSSELSRVGILESSHLFLLDLMNRLNFLDFLLLLMLALLSVSMLVVNNSFLCDINLVLHSLMESLDGFFHGSHLFLIVLVLDLEVVLVHVLERDELFVLGRLEVGVLLSVNFLKSSVILSQQMKLLLGVLGRELVSSQRVEFGFRSGSEFNFGSEFLFDVLELLMTFSISVCVRISISFQGSILSFKISVFDNHIVLESVGKGMWAG